MNGFESVYPFFVIQFASSAFWAALLLIDMIIRHHYKLPMHRANYNDTIHGIFIIHFRIIILISMNFPCFLNKCSGIYYLPASFFIGTIRASMTI